jgi:hypothetical protein
VAAGLAYSVEMTGELARSAVQPLTAVLWTQNQRGYERGLGRIEGVRPAVRIFGLLIAALGLGLALWMVWSTGSEEGLVLAPIFAATFILLLVADRVRARLRRLAAVDRSITGLRNVARRSAARTAARIMGRVERRAPYHIEYQLDGATLTTRVNARLYGRPLDLHRVRVAYVTDLGAVLFRRPRALLPSRVVYLAGPETLQAMHAALAEAGVELVEPLKDYEIASPA